MASSMRRLHVVGPLVVAMTATVGGGTARADEPPPTPPTTATPTSTPPTTATPAPPATAPTKVTPEAPPPATATPLPATSAAADARAKEIEAIKREIASFGMIALLAAEPHPRAIVWSRCDAAATPSSLARWRERIADGPITLSSPNDDDARPIPMGAVATVGSGAGVDDVDAFDEGAGKLTPIFQPHLPVHDPDSLARLQHRVPPEAIQRIVRAHFGAFRVCYHAGLERARALSGRIVVRFSIDGDGVVARAADAGSTLRDAEVVSCVVRGFLNLPFPATDGEPVTVLYPLTFTPAD